MIDFETEMMELGRSIQINIHNTRSLIRTPQVCFDVLLTEEAFTVEEYKHTHTHTHTHTHARARAHTHTHTNTQNQQQNTGKKINNELWIELINLLNCFLANLEIMIYNLLKETNAISRHISVQISKYKTIFQHQKM